MLRRAVDEEHKMLRVLLFLLYLCPIVTLEHVGPNSGDRTSETANC